LWTGCREGKVAHAEWRDLDFKKNVLHVQPKPDRNWKVKVREDRFVPVPPGCDGETGCTQREGRLDRADLPERAGQTTGPLPAHPQEHGGGRQDWWPVGTSQIRKDARHLPPLAWHQRADAAKLARPLGP
jgi:hypothetical protein